MLELTLRIVFSLLVVLFLMWGLARVARRPLARRGGGGGLAVVARQQLSRNAAVAVLDVAGRGLVLGVTDQQVSVLGETDLAAFARAAEPARRSPVRLTADQTAGETADRTADGAAELDGTPPGPGGALAGSVLSLRTWSQTVDFLRERTARR